MISRIARIFISGRVQGVGFRYATYRQARRQGVRGWVRNRRDGRVEVLLHGDTAAVGRVIAWCRQGPAGAAVENIEVSWEEFSGEPPEFEIMETV